MIIYDLQCEQDHTFEAWFGSKEEYERELKARRLECPFCGDRSISILPTGGHVSVSVKPEKREEVRRQRKQFSQAVSEYLEKNFDNVGPAFAREALKMHFDEVEYRNIRGTMTDEEEKELQDEGVQYMKVPVRKFSS